jgi:hypothetical protein
VYQRSIRHWIVPNFPLDLSKQEVSWHVRRLDLMKRRILLMRLGRLAHIFVRSNLFQGWGISKMAVPLAYRYLSFLEEPTAASGCDCRHHTAARNI